MLYGGRRLPLRAPRAKPAPSATQITPTTANPIYNAQSEPARKNGRNDYLFGYFFIFEKQMENFHWHKTFPVSPPIELHCLNSE